MGRRARDDGASASRVRTVSGGCLQCKSRRVCCSLDKPICRHCEKSGLQCMYGKRVKVIGTMARGPAAADEPTTPGDEFIAAPTENRDLYKENVKGQWESLTHDPTEKLEELALREMNAITSRVVTDRFLDAFCAFESIDVAGHDADVLSGTIRNHTLALLDAAYGPQEVNGITQQRHTQRTRGPAQARLDELYSDLLNAWTVGERTRIIQIMDCAFLQKMALFVMEILPSIANYDEHLDRGFWVHNLLVLAKDMMSMRLSVGLENLRPGLQMILFSVFASADLYSSILQSSWRATLGSAWWTSHGLEKLPWRDVALQRNEFWELHAILADITNEANTWTSNANVRASEAGQQDMSLEAMKMFNFVQEIDFHQLAQTQAELSRIRHSMCAMERENADNPDGTREAICCQMLSLTASIYASRIFMTSGVMLDECLQLWVQEGVACLARLASVPGPFPCEIAILVIGAHCKDPNGQAVITNCIQVLKPSSRLLQLRHLESIEIFLGSLWATEVDVFRADWNMLFKTFTIDTCLCC